MLSSKNRINRICADELRTALSGVALPGEALFDKGCRVWNDAVTSRQAIIAFCGDPRTCRRRCVPRGATA